MNITWKHWVQLKHLWRNIFMVCGQYEEGWLLWLSFILYHALKSFLSNLALHVCLFFLFQMNAPIPAMTVSRVMSLTLNFVRVFFWAIFNELILHFFYFNSLQHSSALKTVSLFTVAGIGYCQGQFFMVKYLVMFGLPASVARVDNLDPPLGPKCISYIHLYSDMWK